MPDVAQVLPLRVAQLAAEDPDRPFVEEVEDGERLTYGETHRHARCWAAFLRDLGVREGEPVATMLPTRVPFVKAWLGIAWLKAVDVAVNKELIGNLLGYVLSDSTAKVLVMSVRYLDQVRAVLHQAPQIETVVLVDGDGELPGVRVLGAPDGAEDPGIELEGPQEHELGAVLYTSGTTGPSKGVRMPWGQLAALGRESLATDHLGPDDAVYAPYAMHHVTGRTLLYTAALVGGRCILREQFKTDRFWDDVERHRATTTCLMGTMADFLYRQPGPDPFETPLRYALIVPLVPQIEAFKRRFGIQVRSCFNMTETSVPVCTPGFDLFDDASCGRVRPGAQVKIVDEHDREVEPGVVGEIIVRTDEPWTMNDGYWNAPEKTVEAWRNLWFHTGDAGRVDAEGNFYYVDRLKDSIRRRGVNISSVELEREVLACLDVAECAAIGVPSEHMEEEVKLVVVRAAGSRLTAEQLSAFLADRVPKYMNPRYVEFVDALPKTPTHKVKKADLRAEPFGAATWDRLAGQPERLARR